MLNEKLISELTSNKENIDNHKILLTNNLNYDKVQKLKSFHTIDNSNDNLTYEKNLKLIKVIEKYNDKKIKQEQISTKCIDEVQMSNTKNSISNFSSEKNTTKNILINIKQEVLSSYNSKSYNYNDLPIKTNLNKITIGNYTNNMSNNITTTLWTNSKSNFNNKNTTNEFSNNKLSLNNPKLTHTGKIISSINYTYRPLKKNSTSKNKIEKKENHNNLKLDKNKLIPEVNIFTINSSKIILDEKNVLENSQSQKNKIFFEEQIKRQNTLVKYKTNIINENIININLNTNKNNSDKKKEENKNTKIEHNYKNFNNNSINKNNLKENNISSTFNQKENINKFKNKITQLEKLIIKSKENSKNTSLEKKIILLNKFNNNPQHKKIELKINKSYNKFNNFEVNKYNAKFSTNNNNFYSSPNRTEKYINKNNSNNFSYHKNKKFTGSLINRCNYSNNINKLNSDHKVNMKKLKILIINKGINDLNDDNINKIDILKDDEKKM